MISFPFLAQGRSTGPGKRQFLKFLSSSHGAPHCQLAHPDGPLPFRQRAGRQRPWSKRPSNGGSESLQLQNANDATDAARARATFPPPGTAAPRELRGTAAASARRGPRVPGLGAAVPAGHAGPAPARVLSPRPGPRERSACVCVVGARTSFTATKFAARSTNCEPPPPPPDQGRVPLAGGSGTPS